jgi:hypothetical protein
MSSERLNTSVPLLAIFPEIEPLVPPLPICNTPAEIVVPPVCVFVPVRMKVPPPAFVNVPLPLIEPEYVCVPLRS